VVVVGGGVRKTAELPQFVYDHGLCKDGAVAITQPRRVATVTLAQRVAEEMGVQLGETVRAVGVLYPDARVSESGWAGVLYPGVRVSESGWAGVPYPDVRVSET
jgi:hypothetical protein